MHPGWLRCCPCCRWMFAALHGAGPRHREESRAARRLAGSGTIFAPRDAGEWPQTAFWNLLPHPSPPFSFGLPSRSLLGCLQSPSGWPLGPIPDNAPGRSQFPTPAKLSPLAAVATSQLTGGLDGFPFLASVAGAIHGPNRGGGSRRRSWRTLRRAEASDPFFGGWSEGSCAADATP